MENTSWYNHSSCGQNVSCAYNRQCQFPQFQCESSYSYNVAAMTPNSAEYYSTDDTTPLYTFLHDAHPVEEPMGYTPGSSTLAQNEDIMFEDLARLSDTELLEYIPDFPGMEELISTLTDGSATNDQPPTPPPAILPENLTKRPGAGRRSTKRPSKKPRSPRRNKKGNRSIHLWEFLKEMLNNGEANERYIKWISKREGIFQLVNSSGVAKLWGQRKNRKNMTYEKMSRALRYYYEKDILERVPNARLIYKFGGKTKVIATGNTGEETLSDSSEN